MRALGSKALELLLVAVRWYVIGWVLLVGYLVLLCLAVGLGVPLYFYLHESHAWRLLDVQAFLLPVACTAFAYWLMDLEPRYPRAVALALATLVILGTTSFTFFGIERALGLSGAAATYTVFQLGRRRLAQTLALALGAMLVGFEIRAWYDMSLERQEATARCEAKAGVLVRRHIRGELVCLALVTPPDPEASERPLSELAE
ncbi:MAG TPA: hypothetical protein VI197_06685 [Polyangiaceae bacterium]